MSICVNDFFYGAQHVFVLLKQLLAVALLEANFYFSILDCLVTNCSGEDLQDFLLLVTVWLKEIVCCYRLQQRLWNEKIRNGFWKLCLLVLQNFSAIFEGAKSRR